MDKIKNYLNYIFSDYPSTREIEEIKDELLVNLTDRINDYQNDGYDEKEAINLAIDSLGDTNELLESFNIKPSPKQYSDDLNDYIVKIKEVNDNFKATKKGMALKIAIGVFLIIQALAVVTLFDYLLTKSLVSAQNSGIGDAYLFLNIGIGVVLFIFAGFDTTKYELKTPYTDEEIKEFEADRRINDLKFKLREETIKEASNYNPLLVTGIALCIFAIIPRLLVDSELGDFVFLLIIACAIGIIIYSGVNRGLLPHLLVPKETEEEKKIGRFASTIMIMSVIVYLICGFIFNLWHPTWLVFPLFALCIPIYATFVTK